MEDNLVRTDHINEMIQLRCMINREKVVKISKRQIQPFVQSSALKWTNLEPFCK
jgi:hypothetical protein